MNNFGHGSGGIFALGLRSIGLLRICYKRSVFISGVSACNTIQLRKDVVFPHCIRKTLALLLIVPHSLAMLDHRNLATNACW
jgi:hypothetical protein